MVDIDYATERAARREIVNFGLELFSQGLVFGSGGNISVRMNRETFLFTPTGWFLNHLAEESISKTDEKGFCLSGPRPTKEVPLHLATYCSRPDVIAVVHTHSPYATALACTLDADSSMPIYTSALPGKVGRVIVTEYAKSGSDELGKLIEKYIVSANGVLLGHHGTVAVGSSLREAVSAAYEIEASARLYFITSGNARVLHDDVVANILNKREKRQ
jgi:ribulose-5-phosphate 4-epimerase/fuculose-1-phosphate aldolase